MLVARDDEAVERRVRRPVLFHRERHGRGGLARADDERFPLRRLRQVLRDDLQRVRRRDRRLKAT
jgi:hypothetical protein